MSAGAAVARLEGVTVRYGRKPACEQVSLSVGSGSVYALLGRNGAGKSSLVRCLLGMQKPEGGAAFLFDRDSWKTRADAMAKTGVVPEEPDAPPSMTARQLADFCRRVYPRWDAGSATARLARFEVSMETPFGKLSKGQKGQVMLALALGHAPPLLVLDDPTLGLDPVARQAFLEELVGDLADRGTTVLITTHDLAGIEGIATHVGILKEGRLVVNETLDALKTRFRRLRYANEITPDRTEYGNELDEFDAVRVKVRGWGIEATVSNFNDESFQRLAGIPGLSDAEAEGLSLEEIFLAVAGEARKEEAR